MVGFLSIYVVSMDSFWRLPIGFGLFIHHTSSEFFLQLYDFELLGVDGVDFHQ